MFKRKKIGAQGRSQRIDTLIGAGTHIIGDVVFAGGFHLDGRIKGNVESSVGPSSILSVSDAGVIEGSVSVPHVILNGMVSGDIQAHEKVELGATARVAGNVYYCVIEMAVGAEINGKLVHRPKTSSTTD
jgi:cytoskeletal protein CcmA (bactofilin family)